MNRWNIPDGLEREIVERDRCCIYCRVEFKAGATRSASPSWEHIINDVAIITRENVARCCFGCNSSKGKKTLAEWFESRYCTTRGFTGKSGQRSFSPSLHRRPEAAAETLS